MRKALLAAIASSMLLPCQAQLFSRESLGGAAVGGLIGGIIGHNSGRKTAEGIGIGAGAGLLLGALSEPSRREPHITAPAPAFAAPAYSYYPARPNYAVTGAALGGLAGGVIGHNSGRKTAEGVAIGAGAGLVLGALAEQDARRQEVRLASTPAHVVTAQASVPPQPVPAPAAAQAAAPSLPPAPIIHNYNPGTVPSPMSSANSLFGR
ncbi:MAG: hypothetical protein HY735_06340 [Verrucomicrobia bacterium]|nr:hypothetical protein [Verrucomicrobiota bacterium]